MQTVCAYCGVGCKFEVTPKGFKGVKSYPANKGLSCAKGLSGLRTMDINRLRSVQIRDSITEQWRSSTYTEAVEVMAQKIRETDPKRVGFYLSGQMLNEDYYVANKLAKGFIGTPNCDTNSRTCMSSAVAGYKKAFGVDYVPVRMEDIQKSDLLMLIGANPAESHVVLFRQIRQAQKKGLKLIVIDPRHTMTAQAADLHIPIIPGKDIDLLNALAQVLIEHGKADMDYISRFASGYDNYTDELSKLDTDNLLEHAGVSPEAFGSLADLWTGSEKIMTAWTMGVNQSVQGVEKNLAIHNLHIITGQINKEGCGPLSLTGQPNAMGGREVGGLSSTLAAHLDYTPSDIAKVELFWGTDRVPNDVGLTAFEMMEAAAVDKMDVLIICHTDPVYHLPDRHFVEMACKKIPMVVEINAYEGSETSAFAHIRLPALPFGFKDGTQTNLDRTLTRSQPLAYEGGVLQDWEIFAMLGRSLGFEQEFSFGSSKEVFAEYSSMTRLSEREHLNIFEADYDQLAAEPFVWGEGLFVDNDFLTDDHTAHLHTVLTGEGSEETDGEYPLIMLTGRTRDQWHSGSKTATDETLLRFKPLEFVEVSQADADKFGLRDGDSATIASRRGTIKATVIISDILEGVIFVPVSHRDINYLTPPIVDPVSKEPDYNHTAVKIS